MKATINLFEKVLGIICIGICCTNTAALAADYYVSPSGSASWSACTNINLPCSLQTASNNAVAGDTVYLRGGTYALPFVDASGYKYWEMGFTPSNSGTQSYPITFKAYDDENVFLDNSVNAGQANPVSSYGANYTDYIIFDGLDTAVAMSDGKGKGVTLHGATGCVIKNADIQGAPGGTSNNNCIRLEHAVSSSIVNCQIHGSTGSTNSTGLTSYSSNHTQVTNCTFYNNTQGLYDKDGSENNTYTYNFFYDNYVTGYGLANASTGPDPHDIRLSQNVFVLNSRDIDILGSTIKKDITVDNNTFYSANGEGVFLWAGKVVDGLYVYNNIFYGNDPATRYEASITVYSDYNNFYEISSGHDGGSHSITDNPNFNAGGTSPEDYKRTSYPQDGRGGGYPSVMGAYITGNEIIGYNGEGATPPHPDGIGIPQDFQNVSAL